MNAKQTAAILAVVGVVGSTALLIPTNNASKADLERFDSCPGANVACDLIESGGRYTRRVLAVGDCRDAGLGFVVQGRKERQLAVVPGSCMEVAEQPGTEMPLRCACRKKAGTCEYTDPDGGTHEAPFGRTLGPGYPPFEAFNGTGCEPKVCVELFGSTSWPSICPTL